MTKHNHPVSPIAGMAAIRDHLKPHQQRVIDEAIQLYGWMTATTKRADNLRAFIKTNPTFGTLHEAEQVRMRVQLVHMRNTARDMNSYLGVVVERVDAFRPA